MSSKITELMSKMSSVASGKSHLDNPEEFAFCAGQIVSYLIDRSAASNKNYSLLEPYLQNPNLAIAGCQPRQFRFTNMI